VGLVGAGLFLALAPGWKRRREQARAAGRPLPGAA